MHQVHTIKILLVEDIEINRKLILLSFKGKKQINVECAAHGEEAVEKVQQEGYDIILMDLYMPDMNGYEAARAIRDLHGERYKKIPIIAISGERKEVFDKNPEAILFTDALFKPFDANDLMQKVLQYTSTINGPAASEASEPFKAGNLFRVSKERKANFYKEAEEELQAFKIIFKESIIQRDVDILSEMKHKVVFLLHILSLHDLPGVLEKSKRHLNEKASASVLEQDLAEGEAQFDQALATLRERMKVTNLN